MSSREQLAFDAYMNILKTKGASADAIERRCTMFAHLLVNLEGKPCNGEVYRQEVENTLESLDKHDWSFFLVSIREFFRFWTGDIKAIAHLNMQTGFDIEPIELPIKEQTLQELWLELDKTQFTTAENWPLKAYMGALRSAGASKEVIDTRVKLVKLLLVKLREAPEYNNRRYRATVDSSMTLFESKKLRFLFLAVVREFYNFWSGEPEPEKYLQIDESDLIL